MTTRRNPTSNNLLPLTNTEAIIRAGNAEQRRAAVLQDQPISPLSPHTLALLNSPSMADASNNLNDRSADQTADPSDLATAKDWFKKVLKAQHASIVQAQEDRQQAIEDCRADCKLFLAAHQDNADCIGRLEELLLAMHLKNKSDPVELLWGIIELERDECLKGCLSLVAGRVMLTRIRVWTLKE
ncbi:hypothetical protein PCANC_09191 [Puccinia coronata f. sp. avenae]|uniref:Uncharacterized protein n=1 Tax=Puccinia coronata f. sp. avenae TaxID=200324 RepID=A0A2N5VV70_9BASI|nr:hypothetical protein PCASD_24068 [Puccinia coronata f. sp. avenae]PLW53894.1 hypothetical protein PCANC_09191 [Puccinia coronata f. sp. avenae]